MTCELELLSGCSRLCFPTSVKAMDGKICTIHNSGRPMMDRCFLQRDIWTFEAVTAGENARCKLTFGSFEMVSYDNIYMVFRWGIQIYNSIVFYYADRHIYLIILGWTTIYVISSTYENETSVLSRLILWASSKIKRE